MSGHIDPEDGFPQPFNFSVALYFLKHRFQVRRAGWNGRGMWIALKEPLDGSEMDLPYIYMCTAQGGFVPWLASQTDLLADDWEFLPRGEVAPR